MHKVINVLKFILNEIGPFLAFYIIDHFWGNRVALVVSITLVIAEFLWKKYKKQKITMLFYAFNSVIIVFGFLEILNIETNIYQFEALLTNLFIAIFWGASVFKEKSIVQEIAESQGRTSVETSEDKRFFFNIFTLFWAFHFLSKGIFYFWIYQNPSIDHPLIVRLVVGKVSFWVMMGGSILLPEKIWVIMNKLRLLPSYRK